MKNEVTIQHTEVTADLLKRQYVPAVVTSACPHCGVVCVQDLSEGGEDDRPLYAESVNAEATVYFHHDVAGDILGHEWQVIVIPRLRLDFVRVEGGPK